MQRAWLAMEIKRVADTRHFDVVIIGAGIAGASLAVALSGEGFSIALVEAQALDLPELPVAYGVHNFDPRVSALTPRSRAFLEKLGAWEAIAAYRYCPYRHMTVWDAEGTGQIEFDRAEVNAPELGHIVENRAIVSALLARVSVAADISLLSPVALQSCARLGSSRMHLEMDEGGALEADLLVAADGALSRVREMMAFHSREWDYGHRAIVATVEVAHSHEETAWQRFLPTGPLALLPLPGGDGHHYCSVVWSLQEHLVDEVLALEDEAFCAELERSCEGRLGAVLGSSRRIAFPLRQRHAVDYVQAGVALVADAAHTIHPLAGQGINLGLQDVAVLAEELVAGHHCGVSPGQLQLLRRYQRRRKGENLMMMSAMDGFKRLFEQQSLPLRWLRNAGMRTVDQMQPLKQQLMRHAMGLG
jgi:2-octaprenylphenol hydroxylase